MLRRLHISNEVALGFFIAALVFFGQALFVYASVGQTADSGTATPNTTALGTAFSGNKASKGQLLGTGLSGTVSTTTVYLADGGGLAAIHPGITIECYDDSGYTTYNAGCSLAPVATPAENAQAKTLTSVATPLTLNPAKYYRLGVGCISSCSGGTNPNLITYGSSGDEYGPGDFSSGLNIVDLYFEMTGADGASILTFTNPTIGVEIDDFGAWSLSYSYSTSTPLGGGTGSSTLEVYYSTTSSSTATYTDNGQPYQITTDTQTIDVPKSHSLIQIPEVNNKQWWVWATLYDFYGSPAVSTTPFQFGVDIPAIGDFNPTSTVAALDTTCDSADGFFANSLCYMLQVVFKPTQASIDNFSNLKTALEHKPPFGYITSLTGALTGLSSSASSTFDLSDLSNATTVFDPFRALISWVFWFLFGFWVYNKFRHMKY